MGRGSTGQINSAFLSRKFRVLQYVMFTKKAQTLPLRRLIGTVHQAFHSAPREKPSRRDVFKALLPAALAGPALLAKPAANMDVGIVGAGLAGLSCAWELRKVGISATVYEASNRTGGRCWSLGGQFSGPVQFPGQVLERGGELIDNLHKTMLSYAREFGLTLEDIGKMPGEVFYFLGGQRIPEARVVEEFRAFVPAMKADLRRISMEPSAANHTPEDVVFDKTSLREYLETRGAGPIFKAAIEQAYIAEYGLSLEQQSCLNFLLFIHADRRSKFTPLGVFSDERFHIVEGNESIAKGLTLRIPDQIQYGRYLIAATHLPSGRIRLTFAGSATADHDAIVLACPFSVLRTVDLSGLTLPAPKQFAIQNLGYGTNAKMMVGFTEPYWRGLGSNGASYADLENVQTTWESNPSRADSTRAVITDYSSALRGLTLNQMPLATAAGLFVSDLDKVYPGIASRVRIGSGGEILAHLEHWPSNPLSRGSYTCYTPGQFTSIAGIEGTPAGNVFFAGEHTNSFFQFLVCCPPAARM